MGRGIRNYGEVWEKLDELKLIREELCELVGSEDNNVILRWIQAQKKLSHPCPGKFLLGLTKPKQDSARKTWDDFLEKLKSKGASQASIEYTLDKLSRCSSIEESVQMFERLFQEIKNDFKASKEKTFRRFNQ